LKWTINKAPRPRTREIMLGKSFGTADLYVGAVVDEAACCRSASRDFPTLDSHRRRRRRRRNNRCLALHRHKKTKRNGSGKCLSIARRKRDGGGDDAQRRRGDASGGATLTKITRARYDRAAASQNCNSSQLQRLI